ncbi:MAG: SBBP repeat-containing protein [Bacteroidota bacterium]|jgi:hypothetical protein
MIRNNAPVYFQTPRLAQQSLLVLILFLFTLSAKAQQKQQKESSSPAVSFQENKGQVGDQNYRPRPDVLFSGTDGNIVYHLKNNGISYQLSRVDSWKTVDPALHLPETEKTQIPDQTTIYRIDVSWLNANTNAPVKTGEALPGVSNFYTAVCPNGVTGVQSFNSVTYQQLYSGIDLKWYSKDNHLKYDYLVAPGADYKQIQLTFNGAQSLSVNSNGELIIKTPLGSLAEQAPVVFQDGKILPSKWIINNNVVSFQIENIDASLAFTIDPFVRVWGTYMGDAGFEYSHSCVTDAFMDVYMAGETTSTTSIATSGSFQNVFGGATSDAYLTKLNSLGVLLWSTYYGGTGNDYGYSIAIDPTNKIYLAGYTGSATVIATPGTHQDTYGGGAFDCFLAQFNFSGVRQWGTYYGGAGQDNGFSCALDGFGNVYMTGYAGSASGIATAGALQTTFGGGLDAFLVKFLSNGTRAWGTYMGGAGTDISHWVCTDLVGDVYICGEGPASAAITTAGAHQTVYGGGTFDVFLAKFDGTGARLWSTYYGGAGPDNGNICEADAFGNVYLAGYTGSLTAIATAGSFQPASGGGSNDAFLVKFNSSGVRQWGTYYGGPSVDFALGCKIDALGNFYLMGFTASTTGIATAGSYQTTYGGGSRDAFVAQFSLAGALQWGTYLGGTGEDRAYSGSTDLTGNIYLTGWSSSPNTIATPNASQTTFGGGTADAFLAKFKDCTISISSASQTNNVCFGGTIGAAEITVTGGTGGNTFDWFPGNPAGDGTASVSGLAAGTYTVVVTDNSTCNAIQTFTITEPPQLITTLTASGIFCFGGTTEVTVIGIGGTAPYSGEGTFNVSAGLQSFTLTDANGCSATTSFTFTEPPALVAATSSSAIMCYGDTSFVTVSATGGVGGYSGTGSFQVIAGTYVYTVTDANGCADTSSIIVTQPTEVSVISTGQDIACTGGTTVLNITGANGIAPYLGEGAFTVSAGTYTFTITDSDGCIGTLNLTVTEPDPLIASAASTPIFCNGGTASVTVSATGGTPAYSNTGTYTQTVGTYSYIVTDTNGCADTTTITLTEPTPLVVSGSATAILCNGGTADITISASGGTPGYVNDGTFTQTAGTYTFYVSDENGCEDSVIITVTEPAAVLATIVTVVDPTTCGGTDGAIDISVGGGTPGYSYLWNTTANTEDITSLNAGNYSCSITDTNGCTGSFNVSLADPNPPTVTLAIIADTVCNLDGAFVLTGGSPAGGTYAGPGVTAGSFDPTTANAGINTITYTYTDAQTSCSASVTDVIYVDPCTGVAENLAENTFSVFPNPNNGIFTLQLNTTEIANVLIYDAVGKLVSAMQVQPNVQQQIAIESAGVYLITVVTDDGLRSSQRIVVNL